MAPEVIETDRGQRLHVAWDLGAVVVLVVGVLIVGMQERGSTAVGVGLIGGSVTLLLRTYSMRRTRLVLEGATLTCHGWVRARVMSSVERPARVVHVTLTGVAQKEGQIWFGPESPVMLMTAAWGEARLAELAQRLRCDVVVDREPRTLPSLAQRYPGVLPWYGAHPTLAGVVGLAVLMALGLAIAL
ncbi:MAG: hypothetical protein J7513_11370 [Solirubrobacteraceae bacterium]|nr:hypothetical protein [Solirubrobacteraceae bacterium]